MTNLSDQPSERELRELEERYDPELRFRKARPPANYLIGTILVAMSVYHYYTGGFGTPATHWHSAIHLSFVLVIAFLVYGGRASGTRDKTRRWWRPFGIPLWDWLMAGLAVVVVLYIPFSFASLVMRVGNPDTLDVVFGTFLVLLLLEATRRSLGWPLTCVALFGIAYALLGRYIPGVFQHPGASWSGLINHIYLQQEGIYGIPLVVVSTFVFHFVLFGVIATKMGLGQLFIDLAFAIAGRYPGGPAKVSVISSALFGTISGSSVANTVTTGSLTIPAMKRVGYRPHFAAAVEAAASTGGQITPPIMGAAAFIMAEFLSVPYSQIILAALVPALMHYIAVFTIVHLEAKRTGLRGMPEAEIPKVGQVLRRGWPSIFPLGVLLGMILYGYTPFLSAFGGITACILVGFLNPMHRMTPADLLDALATGAKHAISVGVAAASVGIFVGVITLSGVGFKISFTVTQLAAGWAEDIVGLLQVLPFELFTQRELTLFLTLVFVALTCVAMGAGVPTTALYVILVTLAAPALTLLGVPPLAAHFFVLYFGVLADLTPPVCVAAYAAAAIAAANPFRTGLTAFQLGNAKVLVPFVFVYSPAMLIVIPGQFTWFDFLFTSISCAVGIGFLGTAIVGYLAGLLAPWQRLVLGVAALLLVDPRIATTLVGLAIGLPVVLWQLVSERRAAKLAGAAVPAGNGGAEGSRTLDL